MRFLWKIFGFALTLSLASGVLAHSSLIWSHMIRDVSIMIWFPFIISILTFFVNQVLVFGVFYLLGGEVNLTAEFMPVVVSLFLGCWLGNVTSYFSIQFISLATFGGSLAGPWLLLFLWYFFRMAFSGDFFVGFTALSIAHLTKKTP